MNPPPLTQEERGMFHEIMEQLRHTHDHLDLGIARVSAELRSHVEEEDQQYSDLRQDNAKLRDQVTSLREEMAVMKTRWGMLASFAGLVGAAITTVVHKLFF